MSERELFLLQQLLLKFERTALPAEQDDEPSAVALAVNELICHLYKEELSI
jgi:hypothetical protein